MIEIQILIGSKEYKDKNLKETCKSILSTLVEKECHEYYMLLLSNAKEEEAMEREQQKRTLQDSGSKQDLIDLKALEEEYYDNKNHVISTEP